MNIIPKDSEYLDNEKKCLPRVQGTEELCTPAMSCPMPILQKVLIQGNKPCNGLSTSKRFCRKSSNSPISDNLINSNDCLTSSDEAIKRELPSNGGSNNSSPTSLAVSSNNSSGSSSMAASPRALSPSSFTHSVTQLILSPPPSVVPPSSISSGSSVRSDDELTSLSWLQDSNLLKGTALSPIKLPNRVVNNSDSPTTEKRRPRAFKRECKSEPHSPTKVTPDFKRDDNADSPSSEHDDQHRRGPSILLSNHQDPFTYNPKIHLDEKPPYSFSCLIFMAIEESAKKALPVKDIYTWILDHYPYYKKAPTGWKNSVRHNLSLNKCFCKVEKSPNLGKGSLWMVDPTHRPNLLQSITKAPLMPGTQLNPTYTLTSKGGKCILSAEIRNTDLKDHVNPVEELPSSNSDAAVLKILMNTGSHELNGKKFSSPQDSPRATSDDTMKTDNNNSYFAPNPELFPRLAKRLQLCRVENRSVSPTIDVQIEDVDAAAAMLILKHGPQMLTPMSEAKLENENYLSDSRRNELKRNLFNGGDHVSISDHCYHNMQLDSTPTRGKSIICYANNDTHMFTNNDEVEKKITSISEKNWKNGFETPFEAENALFNLASIATSLASKQEHHHHPRVPSMETQTLQPESQLVKSQMNTRNIKPIVNLRKRKSSRVGDHFVSRKSSRIKTEDFVSRKFVKNCSNNAKLFSNRSHVSLGQSFSKNRNKNSVNKITRKIINMKNSHKKFR